MEQTSVDERLESTTDTGSRESKAPLLPGAFPSDSPGSSINEVDTQQEPSSSDGAGKARKRDFWKLGKKSDQDKQETKAIPTSSSPPPTTAQTPSRASASHIAPITALRPSSPLRRAVSPQHNHPYGVPGSPGRGASSSPRMHSPASSQIFERDVQEDVVPSQASPQIPSHIITENMIPSALDASSEAITNAKLDPDSVEIITHADHVPGAAMIPGSVGDPSMTSLHEEVSHHLRPDGDTASNYGALDTSDIRRLSFISFADVVHSEHAAHEGERRDSSQAIGIPGSSGFTSMPRSPSPLRSPVSSHGLSTSPPTSVSTSGKGLEASPSRNVRGAGSPPPPGGSAPLGGELNIETMRQALRKTGSGDLSGFRSQPLSAVGNDDGSPPEKPFR